MTERTEHAGRKVAVVGSRLFTDYRRFSADLSKHLNGERVIIVSGGAAGVDTMAELYAKEHGLPSVVFRAKWKEYGRSAGVIRNRSIVDACDEVVAFWDGSSRGTGHTVRMALEAKKPVRVFDVSSFVWKVEGA